MSQKGSASFIFIPIGLLILSGVIFGSAYLSNKNKTNKSYELVSNTKKEQPYYGITLTAEGLLKLDRQGNKVGVYPDIKVNTLAYAPNNPGNFSLLLNGNVTFIGTSDQLLAPKTNTIYTLNPDFAQKPQPLLTLPEPEKIMTFALSPDNKRIALTSVTLTEKEIYDAYAKLAGTSAEKQNILQQQLRTLKTQLSTVVVFDLQTQKEILQIKLPLPPENESKSEADRIIWKKSGIFVLGSPNITIFNSEDGSIVTTITDDTWKEGNSTPLRDIIVISPDGSKYFNGYDLTVRTVVDNKIVTSFTAAEFTDRNKIDQAKDLKQQIIWSGRAAFSPDSRKVLFEGESVNRSNFIIWELDLGTRTTKKIGDISMLDATARSVERNQEFLGYYLPFLSYDPAGDKITFAVWASFGGKAGKLVGLFNLTPGDQKAKQSNVQTKVDQLQDITFLGWYNLK